MAYIIIMAFIIISLLCLRMWNNALERERISGDPKPKPKPKRPADDPIPVFLFVHNKWVHKDEILTGRRRFTDQGNSQEEWFT